MSTAIHVTRYIVSQKLAGNDTFLCIIRHALEGFSPSEIATVCNTSKNSARAYLTKLSAYSTITRTLVVAKYVLPIALDVVPTAVVTNDGKPYCTLCNSPVEGIPQLHVSSTHKDIVNSYTILVLAKLQKLVTVKAFEPSK
jgi:ribosomal protein L34E